MTPSDRIPDTHAEAWAMLPFLINGRLSPEDREWVEHHVRSCAECAREVEQQRPLANQMQSSELPPGFSEQRAFSKLWTRIEASESAVPVEEQSVARETSGGSRRAVRWLAAAVFVQAIGLALLGVSAIKGSEQAADGYRTVTNVEQSIAKPAVRLVFASGTSVAEVTQILSEHDLRLVSGPQGAGVFTAVVNGSRSPRSIAESLRHDARVEFAEPVEQ